MSFHSYANLAVRIYDTLGLEHIHVTNVTYIGLNI